MKPLYKGLILALLHIGIVSTLGAKLLYDRAYRPRIWVKSAIYDPDLPIRGKYLALSVEAQAEGFSQQTANYGGGPVEYFTPNRCDLVRREDHLVAIANPRGEFWANVQRRGDNVVVTVNGETAYFLPEHRSGPMLHDRTEELWFEATIPRKGPPRPIRLGIKKNGVLTPLPGD